MERGAGNSGIMSQGYLWVSIFLHIRYRADLGEQV